MTATRIMIVEDEALIAEDLRFLLERMGYQVVATASSGMEAIRKASQFHPDLVLMDVRLQGAMNGVETARQIQTAADISIIYVTAHAAVIAGLEENNRCTCLAKPFSPLQLQSAIHTVLGTPSKQAE